MAGESLSRVGEHIESFQLIPSGHGKFHISIDGDLVAWHRHEPDAHIFPDLQDMMAEINKRIPA